MAWLSRSSLSPAPLYLSMGGGDPCVHKNNARPCCLRPCWQGPRSAGTIWPGVARCEGPLSAGESGGGRCGAARRGEGGWPGLVLHVPRARAGTAQGGGPAGARARLRLHHLRRIASTRPVAGAGRRRGLGATCPIPPPYATFEMTPGRPLAGGHAQAGRAEPAAARRAARLAWTRAAGLRVCRHTSPGLAPRRGAAWAGIVAPGRSRTSPLKALRRPGESGGAGPK